MGHLGTRMRSISCCDCTEWGGKLPLLRNATPFNLTICHRLSRLQATVVPKRRPLVWIVPIHHPPRLFHPAQTCVQRRIRCPSRKLGKKRRDLRGSVGMGQAPHPFSRLLMSALCLSIPCSFRISVRKMRTAMTFFTTRSVSKLRSFLSGSF